ncbi:hypothetical protein [Bacillus sp. 1NLA3E]|uniref:hypothetical protein n=1 Tax=Bacillus sp. 1NLA3E TaxID=666686 RepID=UPI001651875E
MHVLDIAILFNFQMDSTNPFILVLAGLPHLKTRLALNHHRPLSQRMIMKYEIQPLTREEVSNYIDHHMKLVGAKMLIFTETAVEAIALLSQGWPRVNIVLVLQTKVIKYNLTSLFSEFLTVISPQSTWICCHW